MTVLSGCHQFVRAFCDTLPRKQVMVVFALFRHPCLGGLVTWGPGSPNLVTIITPDVRKAQLNFARSNCLALVSWHDNHSPSPQSARRVVMYDPLEQYRDKGCKKWMGRGVGPETVHSFVESPRKCWRVTCHFSGWGRNVLCFRESLDDI